MKIGPRASILLLAALGGACEQPVGSDAEQAEPAKSALAIAQASPFTAAAGTINQTSVTSLEVRLAGPNQILEQTTEGSMSGTLSGSFEDRIEVVIHPNGRFNAHFTITCTCTVEGREGVLHIMAEDTGELVSPDVATFAGRAVITGGTGELSGLRGLLQIDGTVDVQSGLAMSTYSGEIRFTP